MNSDWTRKKHQREARFEYLLGILPRYTVYKDARTKRLHWEPQMTLETKLLKRKTQTLPWEFLNEYGRTYKSKNGKMPSVLRSLIVKVLQRKKHLDITMEESKSLLHMKTETVQSSNEDESLSEAGFYDMVFTSIISYVIGI